jgi:predicted enzyme related to lactoylglutathione lyase
MKIAMTSIPVNDPVTAFEFYTRVLGFTEHLFMPEAMLAIVVSPDDPHGTALLLEPNQHPQYKAFQEAIYAEGIPGIVFGTDDIHAEYDRLVARGVSFRQPPTESEAGSLAIFDDTQGNLIQLFQAP